MDSERIAEAVIWIGLFLLISGPVHECAHAFTAWKLGDGTAKLFGRVSLDPVRHFDPVGGGLLMLSVVLGLLSNGTTSGFGWAKPTPVNPYNLRGSHADSLVAAAGPLSNLALAAVFGIGFWLNVVLMIFNFIPIAPLDGSHVLFDMVSPRTAMELRAFMSQYGILLLVVVVVLAGQIITPIGKPIVSFIIGQPLH